MRVMEIWLVSYSIPCFGCVACHVCQVMGVLSEQQAASQQAQLMTKTLGDVKHSYLNNMDSLAAAIGQEVQDAKNVFIS